jgi:hypothetical protein
MFDFPEKKVFEQDFFSIDWETLFTLRYEQATLREFFEFTWKSIVEQTLELYEIIYLHIPFTFWQKVIKFFVKSYKTKLEKSLDFEKIAENIQRNRFRMYESIFTEYNKKNQWWKKWGKSIFSSLLKKVCSEYNSPISEVLNLTLEQFFYLYDWILFWENEKTKEGKNINNYATRDVEWAKKLSEKLRKEFNQK